MMFDQLFNFVGEHMPALGAFVVCLLVVSVLCYCFFAWGRREANKRWQHDVDHNSDMMAHEVREKFEKREAVTQARNKFLEERNAQIAPSIKALADALMVLSGEKKE